MKRMLRSTHYLLSAPSLAVGVAVKAICPEENEVPARGTGGWVISSRFQNLNPRVKGDCTKCPVMPRDVPCCPLLEDSGTANMSVISISEKKAQANALLAVRCVVAIQAGSPRHRPYVAKLILLRRLAEAMPVA